MPANAHEIHARAASALVTPAVQEWDTWPFEGPVTPRALAAPGPEPERDGEGGDIYEEYGSLYLHRADCLPWRPPCGR